MNDNLEVNKLYYFGVCNRVCCPFKGGYRPTTVCSWFQLRTGARIVGNGAGLCKANSAQTLELSRHGSPCCHLWKGQGWDSSGARRSGRKPVKVLGVGWGKGSLERRGGWNPREVVQWSKKQLVSPALWGKESDLWGMQKKGPGIREVEWAWGLVHATALT